MNVIVVVFCFFKSSLWRKYSDPWMFSGITATPLKIFRLWNEVCNDHCSLQGALVDYDLLLSIISENRICFTVKPVCSQWNNKLIHLSQGVPWCVSQCVRFSVCHCVSQGVSVCLRFFQEVLEADLRSSSRWLNQITPLSLHFGNLFPVLRPFFLTTTPELTPLMNLFIICFALTHWWCVHGHRLKWMLTCSMLWPLTSCLSAATTLALAGCF